MLEQPGERQLGRGHAVLGGDARSGPIWPGEPARGHREPGDEADVVVLAELEDILKVPVGEVVLF